MIRLGVIGYGARARYVLGVIGSLSSDIQVAAITDPRNDDITRQMEENGLNPAAISFYTDPDQMLDQEHLDGVFVGTRCSLHTAMAKKVFARNLPLYLEKPVATNITDLLDLKNAAASSTSEVVVSFPLRVTPLVRLAKEIIDSGQIGTVEHVQARNNVPYGEIYYQGWYRDENETQGLFLQKATHDLDYINYLLGTKPVMICAMNSKRVYKGDKPAGLQCKDCTEWDDCLESPYHRFITRQEAREITPGSLYCGFAQDTGNEDSGSAIIQYESGMHVCYSQNFFTRKCAGKRGATLFGYKGTLEFDWYTDELRVVMHHTPRVDTHKTDSSAASHGGGDLVLADNFIRVIRKEQKSVSPLEAGLLSCLMCLKAKESAETHSFQPITWPTTQDPLRG